MTFTVYKDEEVDDIQISKDANGAEIKTSKKITKSVPYKYFIRKPNRELTESAGLFFDSYFWKCVKQYDIQPANLLAKRYINDGGTLSEDEKKNYQSLYEKLFTKQAELKALQEQKSEESKEKETKLLDEIVNLFGDIQTIENNNSSNLYQHSAESLARNKTCLWWTLFLSYQDLGDDKQKEVFSGKTFEEKLVKYDEMEENEDKFEIELIQKLLLASSLYYLGKCETQEDFDIAFKLADNSKILDLASKAEIKDVASEISNTDFKIHE